jgi:xanthine dehydrogenase YagS FAD-binding subunit
VRNFEYARAQNPADAVRLAAQRPDAVFVSGGTDLLNLMKEGAQSPSLVVDVNGLALAGVRRTATSLHIGALARMGDVGGHPVLRSRFPVVSQALLESASPQIRNMATIGGNLLQRTRCGHFRDAGSACNKRVPGSGCPALTGETRGHAVFGGSDQCIAVSPSDLAVSLLVVGAVVVTKGPQGDRRIPFEEFQVVPGATPHRDHVLEHGELIVGIEIPFSRVAAHSKYLKLRDRATFEFAVVSVAVGLDLRGSTVRDVRVAFGGVATKAWRSVEAEAALRGRTLDTTVVEAACRAAVGNATPLAHNGFKIDLLQRALNRVLLDLGGAR